MIKALPFLLLAALPALGAPKKPLDAAVDAATQRTEPRRMQRGNTVFTFREGEQYEVETAPGHDTIIKLGYAEQLTGKIALGDSEQWKVDAMTYGDGPNKRTLVVVKPLFRDERTTLAIPTNKRLLLFVLHSNASSYMPMVSFTGLEPPPPPEPVKPPKPPEPAKVGAAEWKFGYTIKGRDYPFKPVAVFDNGQQTFIKLPDGVRSTGLPQVFARRNGERELLNGRVRDDKDGIFWVIDGVFNEAEVIDGAEQVTITRGK